MGLLLCLNPSQFNATTLAFIDCENSSCLTLSDEVSLSFFLSCLCVKNLIFDLLSAKYGFFFLVQYAVGDPVMLWVNKVGPYNNPQETYNYYSLPYCKPGKADAHHKWGGLGEVLQGNELIDSQIEIKFQSKVQFQSISSDVCAAAKS